MISTGVTLLLSSTVHHPNPFKRKGVAKPLSPVSERTKKQLANERLSEIEATRLEALEKERSEKEKAEIARQDAIYAKQLEHIAMYYTEADWINIMAKVEANASLSKTLLGDDDGKANESGTTKNLHETIPSVPDVPQPPVDSSTKSSGTRRKSLGRNRLTKLKSILKELDLDADDKTFIKVVSDEDSTDEAPILWSALAGWEVISTPLGEINALYRSDQSTKHFTTLKEILHMVDRQDLLKLYGMVVTYYENHLVAGAGLMLWGDLQVLIDSQEGGKGSFVWNHQQHWQIRSWRLYTLSMLMSWKTVSGKGVRTCLRCFLSLLSVALGKDVSTSWRLPGVLWEWT
ncbi:hypothetical protein Tco_0392839 [Tanacetum coccineum]